jgi:hypothetical protein
VMEEPLKLEVVGTPVGALQGDCRDKSAVMPCIIHHANILRVCHANNLVKNTGKVIRGGCLGKNTSGPAGHVAQSTSSSET